MTDDEVKREMEEEMVERYEEAGVPKGERMVHRSFQDAYDSLMRKQEGALRGRMPMGCMACGKTPLFMVLTDQPPEIEDGKMKMKLWMRLLCERCFEEHTGEPVTDEMRANAIRAMEIAMGATAKK